MIDKTQESARCQDCGGIITFHPERQGGMFACPCTPLPDPDEQAAKAEYYRDSGAFGNPER